MRRTILYRAFTSGIVLLIGLLCGTNVHAQSFGIEVYNTMMPASGGMAGASVTRPQDLQSAINGNPATLMQFRGTQFSFGGGWAEATYNVDQLVPLPLVGVDPFSANSGTPGTLLGNIGVTQDLNALGLPATVGLGFISNAGAGVDFRGVPEANGTSAQYMSLDMVSGLGVAVTDQLSLGAAVVVGSSFLDGPFVDLGGMVPTYSVRGTLGVNYDFHNDTSLGFYYHSKKNQKFDDAALFPGGNSLDVRFDHPANIGVGLANSSMLDGRLLLAMDVLYIMNSDADFLQAIYEDQTVYQFGAQYSLNSRYVLRSGYAYNTDPMRDAAISSIGGVLLPDGVPALRYVQGQFAAISQHRLTAGIGMHDVLPGLDFDLFAGGMFRNTDQFATTRVSVESYWIGFGVTWRFGRGACPSLCVPDQWGCNGSDGL